ncbi:nuclear transport factor 2 family protein [Vibrio fluvialis]
MINILIPLSGKNTFEVNKQNSFPRILNDIDGQLLIERAAKPFLNMNLDKKITVAVPQKEAEKYQLNKVISLLGQEFQTCSINGDTQGSVCSALLAIESMDLDSPLIISSFEQVLDFDLIEYINEFIKSNVDAGVLTFESIHPKWSFVKVDSKGYVTQAAEKMPISNQAIAGFYYFKSAKLFIESAKAMIRKDVKTNGVFFISPTLNEVILREGVVKALEIDRSKYFHINDEHALEAFDSKVSDDKESLKNKIYQNTRNYVEAFNSRDISKIIPLLSEDFLLKDPEVSVKGKHAVLEYIKDIFSNCSKLEFEASSIFVTDCFSSIIEFELMLSDKKFLGADVIKWNDSNLMTEMNAYLYEIN